MKNLIFISIFSFFSLNTFAECFDAHLEAAIAVNKKREKHYSAMTNGESVKISQSLIFGEKILKIRAKELVEEASYFHKLGINVLCDEFVSLDTIPPIQTELKPNTEALLFVDLVSFRKLALTQIKNRQWPELLLNIKTVLQEKFIQPQYYCMTKHFLDSMYSIAQKAILHAEQAKKIGLSKNPDELAQKVLNMHAKYIGLAENLDINAVDIQQMGAGIICQDVPRINVW